MKKRIFPYLVVLAIFSQCNSPKLNPDKYSRQAFSPEVEALLGKMSIEEKVGQMTQVNLNMVLKDGFDSKDGTIDDSLLQVAVEKYKVGSLLNAVPAALPAEKWREIITKIEDSALKTPHKIPVLYGIDAIHGTTYTQNSTLFPHNIGLAASRDVNLAYEGAKVTAKEVRASGIRWNFDPCLGVGRQPLWSRFEETFGEAENLQVNFGKWVVKGYEEDGLKSPTAVAACMKHYLGYPVPRSGKDRTPAYIPEIELREIFLPPFKAAVDAGVSTVMINSGEINGIPVHANEYLLKTVLRNELGFKGLVVSDWEDIIRLHTRHYVAATPKEAVKMGVMAGIDMSMVPLDYSFYDLLLELVNEGGVPMERIDEAAGRILQLKVDVGLFDDPYPEEEATSNFGKEEYKKVALDAAKGAIVLLRNENNILPLDKTKKVLLAGPTADHKSSLSGSWSYLWQGNDESLYPESFKSIKEALAEKYQLTVGNSEYNEASHNDGKVALAEKLGANQLIVLGNSKFDDAANYDEATLKKQAASVDYIVLCLGENAYAESPGVIDDLTLPQKQLDLANAAIATGKPVILILAEGRPRLFTEIANKVSATLLALRPGSQGAEAIVESLFGEHNPYARLPFTYQKHTGDIVLYDRKGSEEFRELQPGAIDQGGYKPLYPFGFGLSYGKLNIKGLNVDKKEFGPQDKVKVAVDVENEGTVDGAIAIDVFTRDMFASVTPSIRKLRAFKKVDLKAGEKKTVVFELGKDDFSFINRDLKRVTESGDFKIIVGDHEQDIKYID